MVKREPVIVTCTTCGWTASSGTWRPAKRALAAHVARLHLLATQAPKQP